MIIKLYFSSVFVAQKKKQRRWLLPAGTGAGGARLDLSLFTIVAATVGSTPMLINDGISSINESSAMNF